ncbi:MAG: hypothetical protein KF809_13285 [Chloroflexi bacterium]|nr:hypothetical protein [Chloroflexota bacterium]
MTEPRPATLPRATRSSSLPALERFGPPPPEDQVRAWIEARSSASDIVVELHGRGGWATRNAAEDLRRGYDLESTALTRLVAELVLRPPDLRHLDAAFTALVDQQRNGASFRESIDRAFASRCGGCGGPVVVEEFVWEGDARSPSRRSYRCGHCRESRAGDTRTVPVDADDIAIARALDPWPARDRLIGRFPVPEADHELPEQLLDLYTARTLDAIVDFLERLEGDLRAPGIEAALRLLLVGVLLPASKLNSFPGRVAQPRIVAGRLRPVGERQWRERNPWLLVEDGYRTIRGFVQRQEVSRYGQFRARFGPDLMALRDGAANVVVRQGMTLTDEDQAASIAVGGGGSCIRLALTQPPIHWSPENLAFGYLATVLALGLEAALTLPLDAVFDPARHDARSEWARDASELRASLGAVRPGLGADGAAVVLLDRQPAGAVVASVLGAVGAGYRLRDVTFTESGQDITGAIELTTPGGPPPVDRDLPVTIDPGRSLGSAIASLAVGILQARGEPARYERLLGEVLLGLDRSGHLAGITQSWEADAETASSAADDPVLRAPDPVTGGEDPGSRVADPARSSAEPADAVGSGPLRAIDPRLETAAYERLARSGLLPMPRERSWRDPRHPVRDTLPGALGGDVAWTLPEPDGPDDETQDIPLSQLVRPIDPLAPVTPTPTTAASAPPTPTGPTTPTPPADPRPSPTTPLVDPLTGHDPVRVMLDAVADELHRADHPRLMEIEPGRWWLRDPADVAGARPPLADRVEWAVYSLLSTSGGIPAAAFTRRITSMFRGHDTPDEELIRACVDSYRVNVPDSEGLVQAPGSLQDRYLEHGDLVAGLAELGHRFGLRVWLAPREQRRMYRGRPVGSLLNELELRAYLPLVASGPVEAVEQVDCIWYLRGKATLMFEVEWTAMLGEPVLRRGAAIPTTDTLVRFLVIPAARTELVRLKIERSPLLRERLEQDNWHILKAEHLRSLMASETPSLDDLAPLLGLDPPIERLGEQLPLFG